MRSEMEQAIQGKKVTEMVKPKDDQGTETTGAPTRTSITKGAVSKYDTLKKFQKGVPGSGEKEFSRGLYYGSQFDRNDPGLRRRYNTLLGNEKHKGALAARIFSAAEREGKKPSWAEVTKEFRYWWEQELQRSENTHLWKAWTAHDPEAKKQHADEPVKPGKEPEPTSPPATAPSPAGPGPLGDDKVKGLARLVQDNKVTPAMIDSHFSELNDKEQRAFLKWGYQMGYPWAQPQGEE